MFKPLQIEAEKISIVRLLSFTTTIVHDWLTDRQTDSLL